MSKRAAMGRMAPPPVPAMMEAAGDMAADAGAEVRAFSATRAVADAPNAPDSGDTVLTGAVLLRDSSFHARIADVRACASKIQAEVKAAQGHVESSNQHTDEYTLQLLRLKNPDASGPTHVDMRVRVPADAHDAVLVKLRKAVGELGGAVTSEHSSTTDVTSSYVDSVTRQRVERRSLDQLEKLMERAKDVQDVLMVQREMQQITYRLEAATAQRKSMEERAAMSTLHINLDAHAEEPPPPPPPGHSVWRTVRDAWGKLQSSFTAMIDFLIHVVILGVPLLVLGALLLGMSMRLGRAVMALPVSREIAASV